MMDWLRTNGGIGIVCAGEEALGEHLPEDCEEERQEYHDYFEVGLRKAGPAGERAYFAIRQAARTSWRYLHAEDYEGPVMQRRVRDYFGAVAKTGFASPPELLGGTGDDPAEVPSNGTKHPGGMLSRPHA